MKIIKNFIGNAKGFGTCPNCDDNWWWKPNSESIDYEERSGVMICNECMDNKDGLDTHKICLDLLKWGWEKEKVKLVRIAINNYKK